MVPEKAKLLSVGEKLLLTQTINGLQSLIYGLKIVWVLIICRYLKKVPQTKNENLVPSSVL